MTYCTVSGIWNETDNTPLADHTITAVPVFGAVSDGAGKAVAPQVKIFATDGTGSATVTLFAGEYIFSFTPLVKGETRGFRGTVPAQSVADPGDLFTVPAPVGLDVINQAVADAQAAAAEAALYDGTWPARTGPNATALVALGNGTIGSLGGLLYKVDTTATGTASATNDLGVDGLVPFGEVTPEHFGAVGDGVTDDAAALEAAFAQETFVRFSKLYRSSRTINAEVVLAIADRPSDHGVIWDSGVGTALSVTPSRFEQHTQIKNTGFFTKGLGVDTFISVDWSAFDANSRVGEDGTPRQFTRFTSEDCIIAGENSDYNTAGWKVGFEFARPWGVYLRNNSVFGYFQTTHREEADFVADSYGVHVLDGVQDTADFYAYENRIYGFLRAADIWNVEAFRFDHNDIQICFTGVRWRNSVRSLNQVYMDSNHLATTSTSLVLSWGRHAQVTNNQISYFWGRTDSATVDLVSLESFFRAVFIGNTFRGGTTGTITLNAIRTEETVAAANVRDVTFSGNNFFDLNSIFNFAGAVAPIELGYVQGQTQSVSNFSVGLSSASVFSPITYGNEWQLPAEPLFETGSNANGYYVKRADGTLECWQTFSGVTSDSAIGSVFRSPADITWTFPFEFVATTTEPAVSGRVDGGSSWVAVGAVNAGISTGFRRYTAVSDATGRDVVLHATGLWK